MAENLVKDLDDLDPKLDLEKPLSKFSVISQTEETYKSLIKWHVPKSVFIEHLSNAGGYLTSGWLCFGQPSYCCLYFTLYPNGKNETLKNRVSLRITFYGNLPENAWIKGTLKIIGRKISKNFSADNNTLQQDIDDFDETQKLLEYINENDLMVYCLIKMGISEVKCTHDDKSITYNKLSTKCNSYRKQLFEDKKFSDVAFRLQGKEIKAHKAILIGIPFFEDLFIEDPHQIIDLTNIKYYIFEHVLQFIYTDDIPLLDFRLASELYVVANILKIFSLRNICSSYLGANLTVRNVVIVLQLSHECNDILLKKKCFEFIKISDAETLAKDAVIM